MTTTRESSSDRVEIVLGSFHPSPQQHPPRTRRGPPRAKRRIHTRCAPPANGIYFNQRRSSCCHTPSPTRSTFLFHLRRIWAYAFYSFLFIKAILRLAYGVRVFAFFLTSFYRNELQPIYPFYSCSAFSHAYSLFFKSILLAW